MSTAGSKRDKVSPEYLPAIERKCLLLPISPSPLYRASKSMTNGDLSFNESKRAARKSSVGYLPLSLEDISTSPNVWNDDDKDTRIRERTAYLALLSTNSRMRNWGISLSASQDGGGEMVSGSLTLFVGRRSGR